MIRRFSHFPLCAAILMAFAALGVLPASAALAPPAAFVISAKGKVSIAISPKASLSEKTAAQELDDYLTKITNGEFSVVAQNANPLAAPAIYVGDTKFAKAAGVDGSTLESEEWRIKTQFSWANLRWSESDDSS